MKRVLNLLLIGLLVVSLSACKADRPLILTTAYPLSWLVEQIGGDKVQIASLNDGTTQAVRSQIRTDYDSVLEKADLIVHLGELESYFITYDDALSAYEKKIIDLSANLYQYKFVRYTAVSTDTETLYVEAPYYKDAVFDQVDTYTYDPNLWMDPVSLLYMGSRIRDWLVANYPEEEKYFDTQYDALQLNLSALDANYQTLSSKNLAFVSLTPSFGVWQKAYGVSVYPIITSRFGVLPDDRQLQVIKQRIAADGVRYIVNDPLMDDEMRTVYDDLVASLALTPINLTSLFARTDDQVSQQQDYLSLMYQNLEVLKSLN